MILWEWCFGYKKSGQALGRGPIASPKKIQIQSLCTQFEVTATSQSTRVTFFLFGSQIFPNTKYVYSFMNDRFYATLFVKAQALCKWSATNKLWHLKRKMAVNCCMERKNSMKGEEVELQLHGESTLCNFYLFIIILVFGLACGLSGQSSLRPFGSTTKYVEQKKLRHLNLVSPNLYFAPPILCLWAKQPFHQEHPFQKVIFIFQNRYSEIEISVSKLFWKSYFGK